VARKVADEFFTGFSARVAPAAAAVAGPVEGPPAKPGLWLWVAVAVAAVLVAIGAYLLFAD
jgi:hypothetical protein